MNCNSCQLASEIHSSRIFTFGHFGCYAMWSCLQSLGMNLKVKTASYEFLPDQGSECWWYRKQAVQMLLRLHDQIWRVRIHSEHGLSVDQGFFFFWHLTNPKILGHRKVFCPDNLAIHYDTKILQNPSRTSTTWGITPWSVARDPIWLWR